MTREEYQQLLFDLRPPSERVGGFTAVGALLWAALPLGLLLRRMARDMERRADRLAAAVPPADVLVEHRQLIAAFRALVERMRSLAAAHGSRLERLELLADGFETQAAGDGADALRAKGYVIPS